jgi:hypothetical protein
MLRCDDARIAWVQVVYQPSKLTGRRLPSFHQTHDSSVHDAGEGLEGCAKGGRVRQRE